MIDISHTTRQVVLAEEAPTGVVVGDLNQRPTQNQHPAVPIGEQVILLLPNLLRRQLLMMMTGHDVPITN